MTQPDRLLRDTEHYLSALHGSVARHDNLAANLGCAGCELRDRIAAELRRAHEPAGVAPATDRADLRDAIRRAVCEAEGFAWDSDMLEPDEYGDHADMVLAVLPASVDRATVLEQAATHLEADMERFFAEWPDEPRNSPYALGRKDAAAELRRMAAESVPADAGPAGDETERVVAYRSPGTRKPYCVTCARQETDWQPITLAELQGGARCNFCGGSVLAVAAQTLGAVIARYADEQPAGGAQQPKETDTDRVVAYRSALPGALSIYCTRHTDELGDGVMPLTSDDLPDGGVCAACHVDVLIPQQPKETRP